MPTDFLCDADTGDLLCEAGDLVIGDSTRQHQLDLLYANEGDYKEFPVTGVGIDSFLNDNDKTDMIRKIRQQFTLDTMKVVKITAGSNLNIDANY